MEREKELCLNQAHAMGFHAAWIRALGRLLALTFGSEPDVCKGLAVGVRGNADADAFEVEVRPWTFIENHRSMAVGFHPHTNRVVRTNGRDLVALSRERGHLSRFLPHTCGIGVVRGVAAALPVSVVRPRVEVTAFGLLGVVVRRVPRVRARDVRERSGYRNGA